MLFKRKAPKLEHLKIVIVGAGEVGFHIAKHLAQEQKQVVVIDQNLEKLRQLEEHLDLQTILGSGSNPEILVKAGVADANIFLAVTDSDEINMVACFFANAIAPEATKLARIRQNEYSAYKDLLASKALNISMLVNPEAEIVRSIKRLLTLPGAVEYGQFSDGKVRMVGMRVTEGPLLNQPLLTFKELVKDNGIMVGAIARNHRLLIPSGTDKIIADDIVYFIYKPSSQDALLRALNKNKGILSSACIVGGGNIGVRLALMLEKKGVDVKIIERNPTRCEHLADILHGSLILQGDGTDKSLLIEENIPQMDAFIAVSGDEESNILSCLLAKSLGVRETVARVNKADYLPLLESIGIGHSVSPRLSAVNSILHYIRQGQVLSSLLVGGEDAEALEVLIPEGSNLHGLQVKNLQLPKGALLLAISRNGEVSIPEGNSLLQAKDHMVVLSLKNVLSQVERIVANQKPKS